MLDVGGGTGNYALALRDDGFDVTVVDRSPEMLARAEAKGLTVRRAVASRLPFPDAAADAVVAVSMIHLVPAWRATLAEMRRVLAPRGRLALHVYARAHLEVHWILRYSPTPPGGWPQSTRPCGSRGTIRGSCAGASTRFAPTCAPAGGPTSRSRAAAMRSGTAP